VDAFETFRTYLEKKSRRCYRWSNGEQVLDGIVRAAYTFGGALLRRGAGGAGDWLAFTQDQALDEEDEDDGEQAPRPGNVVGSRRETSRTKAKAYATNAST